ncbi:MAG: Permease of the major facilitator superfamily [Oscillospiraceae bacterium]|jgi:MFS transporter, OFA family, oxalate/formate antiporter
MKNLNRWVYAAVGVIILLFAGMVYAWSVLASPIAAEFPDWSKASLSMAFTIVMIMFCVGCLAGGLFSNRFSARSYVIVSAVLFFGGFFMASHLHSQTDLYISFGVICGFASGLVYNTCMSTIGKWFPDRQGLISGILLMGFGLSSFIVGKLYQAFTPDVIGAWRASFAFIGVVTCVVLLICSFFIVKPGADFSPPAAVGAKKRFENPVAMEAPTAVMLKRPAFWLYYLWAILLSAAGLALVSQASGLAKEVGPNVNAGTIATVVGLISIFNGIGRVIFGSLFDKIGRSKTMQTVNAAFIFTALVLILSLKTGNFAILVFGFVCGGLAYGGVTPTNSAFVSSYFGQKYYPVNFSVINTNLIFASFGSTIAGALYDVSGSYMSTYLFMCCLSLVGILVSLGISLADKKQLSGKR